MTDVGTSHGRVWLEGTRVLLYRRAVLDPATVRARPRPRRLPVLVVAAALALGCDPGADDDDAGPDASASASVGAGTRTLERTVRIGLLRVAERTLQREPDGSVTYPDAIPLGDVEVCVAERRDAYAIMAPFTALDEPNCKLNAPDETVFLEDVQANSDLIVTFTKADYEPVITTFRTDEHDVAVPFWADNMAYFVPLVREHAADPFIEPEPAGEDGDGLLAIWVLVNGDWGHGESGRLFGSEDDPGVAQAEDVRVEISDEGGRQVAELSTRRDRPLFVRLPEGAYALRFSHPLMEVVPFGVQEQFMITGLPTSVYDTVEVPVRAGRLTLAAVETYCPLPTDARVFEDLATCTLEPAAPDDTP